MLDLTSSWENALRYSELALKWYQELSLEDQSSLKRNTGTYLSGLCQDNLEGLTAVYKAQEEHKDRAETANLTNPAVTVKKDYLDPTNKTVTKRPKLPTASKIFNRTSHIALISAYAATQEDAHH
jgi:hypothetical protein